jgi:queuine/archaeosine tRNA-ribosyltransferase
MTCRLSRLVKIHNLARKSRRKSRIKPMSSEDERFWEDRRRRIEREQRP